MFENFETIRILPEMRERDSPIEEVYIGDTDDGFALKHNKEIGTLY